METEHTPSRAGRPPLGEERMRQFSCRLTPEQIIFLDELARKHGYVGRNGVIRILVDAARRTGNLPAVT